MSEPPGRAAGRPPARANRGQLALSVVEAGIGLLVVLAVVSAFGLGLPDPGTTEAQLDAYAEDAATVLANEPPRHAGETRLAEVTRSRAAFRRERDTLDRRVGRIMPDNLLYRVETPHGAVGHRKPSGVALGRAAVPTRGGEAVIWVWYA
jgi:hypothetical protein